MTTIGSLLRERREPFISFEFFPPSDPAQLSAFYETAARYEGPVFIIHGQADRIVPYTYGERFHDVMPRSAIEVIPGEDHGFSADTPRAASLAASWLAKTLR